MSARRAAQGLATPGRHAGAVGNHRARSANANAGHGHATSNLTGSSGDRDRDGKGADNTSTGAAAAAAAGAAAVTPASVSSEKSASSISMASPFSPIVLGEHGESVLPKKNTNAGVSEGEKKDEPQPHPHPQPQSSAQSLTRSQSRSVESSGDESDATFETAADDALALGVGAGMSPPWSDDNEDDGDGDIEEDEEEQAVPIIDGMNEISFTINGVETQCWTISSREKCSNLAYTLIPTRRSVTAMFEAEQNNRRTLTLLDPDWLLKLSATRSNDLESIDERHTLAGFSINKACIEVGSLERVPQAASPMTVDCTPSLANLIVPLCLCKLITSEQHTDAWAPAATPALVCTKHNPGLLFFNSDMLMSYLVNHVYPLALRYESLLFLIVPAFPKRVQLDTIAHNGNEGFEENGATGLNGISV
ncbi:hypothetical protein GYMLUDRAFT_247793 [Collybiopsis luxurians FD-317 M1]|uniref:Uncharacterized protein n=1 Tax=Collybiopsis luxurians FD-317 M1 TaxID=944289 RepID=A0A0D0BNK3_9AGAR|nr:hypothetical protein GYMLUDRAFT_247793 [Collybiopsis luxurians FD-317 M1]